jgi:protein TonB
VKSNLNTVARHAGAYFSWEVPDEGVVVRFHLNLVDLLEQEAIRAGNRSAAGVLIGRTENARHITLTIESYEAIAPELRASKSPLDNHRQVAQIVDRWRAGRKRISILGFYRTSTREDEFLDKEDLAALDTGLSAAAVDSSDQENSDRKDAEGFGKRAERQNAQTGTADSTDASLDESGCSSQAVESLMDSGSIQPEQIFLLITPCSGRTSHATFYLIRSGTVVSYSPRMAFSRAELSEQQGPTDARSPELCSAAFKTEDTESLSSDQKLRLETGKHGTALNWRWLTASIVMLVVGVVLFHTGSQQRSDALAHRENPSGFHLGLRLARSGTDWELSWDQNAPTLLAAVSGHLRITDGVIQKNVDLAPPELRTGRIVYTPATDDVVMQLEVESGKAEKPVSESVRIVAGVSPVISGPQVRTTGPSQGIRAEPRWRTPAVTPPALAVRPSYRGSGIPSATTNPLPDTFVKSQKPQSPTARISVAADGPADQPPALGAPPILDGKPALIASTQPSPPVAADPAPSVPPTGGKAEPAQLLSRRDPVYPLAAKLSNVSGTVETHFKISANGEVRNVTVTKGNPALIGAAIDAVRQWRYAPARLNGVPIEAQGTAVVAFRLN